MHYNLRPVDQVLHMEMLDQEVSHYTHQIFTALRDKWHYLASDAVAYISY